MTECTTQNRCYTCDDCKEHHMQMAAVSAVSNAIDSALEGLSKEQLLYLASNPTYDFSADTDLATDSTSICYFTNYSGQALMMAAKKGYLP